MNRQDSVRQWLHQVQMDALAQSVRRHYEKALAEQPRRGLFRRRRLSLAEPRVFSNHVAVETLQGCARLALDNRFPRLAFSLKGGDEVLADLKPTLFLHPGKDLEETAESLEGWRQNPQGDFYRYLGTNGELIALDFPGTEELGHYSLELRSGRSDRSLPDGLRLQVRPQMPRFVQEAMSASSVQPQKKN